VGIWEEKRKQTLIAPWFLISAPVCFPSGKRSWLLRPRGFLWYPNLFALPCLWDLLSRADWLMCQRKNCCPLYNFTSKYSNQSPSMKIKGGGGEGRFLLHSQTSCHILWNSVRISFPSLPSWPVVRERLTLRVFTWLQFHSLLRYKCLVIPRRDLSSYLSCV